LPDKPNRRREQQQDPDGCRRGSIRDWLLKAIFARTEHRARNPTGTTGQDWMPAGAVLPVKITGRKEKDYYECID
jgi:hypothetical protein